MPMIEFTQTPHHTDIEFLTQKINAKTKDYGEANPFGFFIKENDIIIAGANGFVIYGIIYTDQLWVDAKYRHQGLGKQLMNRIHDYERENDCALATVQTMSFLNAENFYAKLGYEHNFKRSGYVKDSYCLFMSKHL